MSALKFLFFACIIASCWLFPLANANTGPVNIVRGWGGITFSSGNTLGKNVSVEKEILAFRTSNKNVCKKDANYIGYDFLQSSKNFSSEFISRNLLDYENKLLDDNEATGFIEVGWAGDDGCDTIKPDLNGSVEIVARYYLRNNSSLSISDEPVAFSFFTDTYINTELTFGKKDVYILHSENDYPQNFRAWDNKNRLSFQDEIMKESFSASEINFHSIKKVSAFRLSFKPQESKTLTITYTIPLMRWWTNDDNASSIIPGSYVKYDFTPIFNWWNGTIKDVYLAVIWDNEHILHSYESIVTGQGEPRFRESYSDSMKRYVYWQHLRNVNKKSNIGSIRIAFSNQENLLSFGFCDSPASVYSDFFCSKKENEDSSYTVRLKSEIRKVATNKDPQKITIEVKDGKKQEYRIFDVLK